MISEFEAAGRLYQGCRTIQLSGQESADVFEGKAVMLGRF